MTAKVFTTVMGAEVVIGLHGTAVLKEVTEQEGGKPVTRRVEQGVVVPDEVAAELEWEMAGCPVDEDGNRDLAGTPSRPTHARYRIEREAPPPRLAPSKARPVKPAEDQEPPKTAEGREE